MVRRGQEMVTHQPRRRRQREHQRRLCPLYERAITVEPASPQPGPPSPPESVFSSVLGAEDVDSVAPRQGTAVPDIGASQSVRVVSERSIAGKPAVRCLRVITGLNREDPHV